MTQRYGPNGGGSATEEDYQATEGELLKLVGTAGLKNRLGIIQEEYLTALKTWTSESKLYLEMRDDTVVATMLDALKLPLMAADFNVEAASDAKGDTDAAEFLQATLNAMTRQTWRSHVSDMLEALDFGFALGEVVLEKREDGHLWLRNIDPRGQETVYKWEFGEGEDRDKASGFIQRDPDGGGLITVPLDKCVHVTLRGRKGNPQGRSILRSVYWPWRFVRDIKTIEAIGVERDVGGMPVVELPENPGSVKATDLTDLDNALIGMRNDERAFVRLPFGVKLTAFGGGTKAYNPDTIIERYEKTILMRAFAQFLKLGMDNVGTQALVKGAQQFFTLGLESIQVQLVEAWQQQLVPLLFQFNSFPGMTDLPRLTWETPGAEDVKALLDAINVGVSSRTITPTREDEQVLRSKLDLPELPEGEGEGPRDEQPAMPGLFDRLGVLR